MKKQNLFTELKNTRKKDDTFGQIFKAVYKDCINCIKNMNNIGSTEIIYTVPMFLIGHPLYDVDKVIQKIILKLKTEGIKATLVQNQDIKISWG